MRAVSSTLLAALFLAVLPALGQQSAKAPYKIDFDPKDYSLADKDEKTGETGLHITVKFGITLQGDQVQAPGTDYKIIIEEDGKRVKEVDVERPAPSADLSVVLALDTSGSMKEHGRMDQARAAAQTFLAKMPAKAECGLILFDHEVRPPELAPSTQREPLLAEILKVSPRGGTAYLDAALRSLAMLKKVSADRERAVVLMTDGIDLNSAASLAEVISQAKEDKTRIYTIGIGEPGKLEKVYSTLVLDHSASMIPPADKDDTTSKIKALQAAASRFVDIMPTYGRISFISFSTAVARPKEFTNDKKELRANISDLKPEGETAILDATYAGIATLEAADVKGKRAVVAMTDGIDNKSRRRVEEVIDRAKEAKVALHMLGFGKPGEIDEKIMREMADQTGGKYYHAKNEKALLEIFENLSIQLHDDGIDEASLTKLSEQTGGRYYPAKNVSDLKFILEKVTQSIQNKEYVVTFKSPRQLKDGTARNIAIKLVRRSGELVSNLAGGAVEQVLAEEKGGYNIKGVVVADMNHMVYLVLLGLIGGLIALPAVLRKMTGTA